MKRVIGVLGIAIIFALLAAIAARYIKPNVNDLLPLFGILFPYFYFAGLAIVPLSFYANRWIGLIGVAVLLSATPHVMSYVQPFQKSTAGAEHDFSVMTYNAMMGFEMVNEHHMFDKQSQSNLSDLLLSAPAPEIVCVQEASDLVRTAFAEIYQGYHQHQLSDRGAIILSKYPIINKGQVDFGTKWNSCVWADVEVAKGKIVRVYSIHFESNRLDRSSYDVLAKADYASEKALKGFWSLIKKYPAYSTKRGDQADLVKDHMNNSPYPLIITGDFNEPPMSYTYTKIKNGLIDTYLESGYGWGTTWRGAVPMLRIDYIFASAEMNNVGFECLESKLSDHYPIKASFRL